MPEAKATNPARDMHLWRAFFEWEDNAHSRLIYQLAMIAAEIRRGNVKDPRLVEVEHFIAKFEFGKKPVAEIPDHDAIVEARTQNSKNYWMVLAGTATHKKRPLPAKVKRATERAMKEKA